MRDTEDQVEVAHWQQFLPPGTQPFFPCIGLALRTVSVSAGVVRDGLMPAPNAVIAVPTERGRAAALDRPKGLSVAPRLVSRDSGQRPSLPSCG